MDRLRFGTFLAPNIMPVYQAVTDEVGRRLEIETELVVETDYEACARDENEVCFVCSLPYVEFERQGIAPAVPIAAPVLEGERYGGKPIYFSDVIVHRDSPSGRSSTCAAGRGPTTSRSRSRATASRATTSSRSGRRTASSARSSKPAFTRSRCGWSPPRGRRLRHRLPGAGRGAARRPVAGSLAAHHRRPRPLDDPARRRVEASAARDCAPRSWTS